MDDLGFTFTFLGESKGTLPESEGKEDGKEERGSPNSGLLTVPSPMHQNVWPQGGETRVHKRLQPLVVSPITL